MNEDFWKNLTLDDLLNTPLGAKLADIQQKLEYAQQVMLSLIDQKDEKVLLSLKSGTILAFAVIKKILEGKQPKDFDKQDWADIALSVADYAVVMDGQSYTEFVFLLYANYIDFSADVWEGRLDPRTLDAVRLLSVELRQKTDQLDRGEITETNYIEDCLWICLDAMLKLLSASLGSLTGAPEFEQLITASSELAFEYGRYRLYNWELQIVNGYLDHQYELDSELQAELTEYDAALKAETEKFNTLIERAFEPGFRDSLKASVELARAAGVKEEEILHNTAEIDDFFLK